MAYKWHTGDIKIGRAEGRSIRVQTLTQNMSDLAAAIHHEIVHAKPPMLLSHDIEVCVYGVEGDYEMLVVVTAGFRTVAEFAISKEPDVPPGPLPEGGAAVDLAEQARALRDLSR